MFDVRGRAALAGQSRLGLVHGGVAGTVDYNNETDKGGLMTDKNTIVEALRTALTGRCTSCGRPLASDSDWESVNGGERPDLCWEAAPEVCTWTGMHDLDELRADAVLSALASTHPDPVEVMARAIAHAADDGCFDRIDAGESDESTGDAEDAQYYRGLARAAHAALSSSGTHA